MKKANLVGLVVLGFLSSNSLFAVMPEDAANGGMPPGTLPPAPRSAAVQSAAAREILASALQRNGIAFRREGGSGESPVFVIESHRNQCDSAAYFLHFTGVPPVADASGRVESGGPEIGVRMRLTAGEGVDRNNWTSESRANYGACGTTKSASFHARCEVTEIIERYLSQAFFAAYQVQSFPDGTRERNRWLENLNRNLTRVNTVCQAFDSILSTARAVQNFEMYPGQRMLDMEPAGRNVAAYPEP
jgi:hypothetical protein